MSSGKVWKTQTQFHRNESGCLDPNAAIRTNKNALHVRCSDEVIFAFSSATVDGEGARLGAFEHVGKKVVTHSHCEKLLKEEEKKRKRTCQ